MKVYNKLVRDRIPDIIRADGHIPQCETLDTARYLDALEQKLLEEAAEYRQTPCMEEMADLMEVIEAICKARGFDPVDDNHADALALLDWAMAQGGVACV